MNQWIPWALLALLTTSCNPPASSGGPSASASKKSTAAGGSGKCLAIVNGTETEGQPAVGMLFQRKNDQIFLCTGTFVGHNTMITAAHCFPFSDDIYYSPGTAFDLTDEDVVNRVTRDAVSALKTIVSPVKLHNGTGIASNDSRRDLAVVIFPDNTAPATVPVLTRPAKDGEPAELVGFGRTEIDGKAGAGTAHLKTVKRHGTNVVRRIAELANSYPDTLLIFGDGSGSGSARSLASNGDSGGPLLVGGAVAGIASTAGLTQGAAFDATKEEAFTVYADLTGDFARKFYADAEKQGATILYSQEAIGEQRKVQPQNLEDQCDGAAAR